MVGVIEPTYEQCVATYEKHGQYAVYDLFPASHTFTPCEPCEDDTPTLDAACAVCGEPKGGAA